ncbi:DUF2461 domain-containing protein [Deinococcus radiomollis]|uniref:DUF2461 domain-containing protein n=1 Tax=Deinococcus radiomollis TaxID=468916 RepID=UPI0038911A5C
MLGVPLNLPRLYRFLTELKFNNEKAWFDAHRSEYQALREEFIDFMAEIIAGVADPGVADIKARDTLFRINRDVRFAYDKSPYKTTFSAAISPGGRHSSLPLYYLQLGADESFVAGGIYAPPPADVAIIRAYVERYPAKADALLNDVSLQSEFGGLAAGGMLKRFPSGFEQVSELLRYRSFTVSAPLDTLSSDDLSAQVIRKCAAMRPLHEWLREAMAYRKP